MLVRARVTSVLESKKVCAACDSTDSKHWRFHDGYWLCHSCSYKYVYSPAYSPKFIAKNNPRRIKFKGMVKMLSENPRTGVCRICDKKIGDTYINCYGNKAIIKQTHLHHGKYDESNPSKYTKELCASCHGKESWQQRRKRKQLVE